MKKSHSTSSNFSTSLQLKNYSAIQIKNQIIEKMRYGIVSSIMSLSALVTITPMAQAQWIDHEVLGNDPRTYCTDIVAANQQTNILANHSSSSLFDQFNNQNSQQSSNFNHRSGGGGGGVNIFKIVGINGNGQSERTSRNNSATNQVRSGRHSEKKEESLYRDRSSITQTVVGKNCDAFVEGAAHVEATQINADVNHHLIDSQERLHLQQLETQSQQDLFQMLLQGW